MSEMITYGLSTLMVCYGILIFLLNRIDTDIIPEEYEFNLDPFWYIIVVMFLGGTVSYFVFPKFPDMVSVLKYSSIALPFIIAVFIYIASLFGNIKCVNIFTILGALTISYMQPNDFQLFPEYLTLWQDRLAIAFIIFIISKGLELLNGVGGIASMQFSAVMASVILLAYFGGLPQVLGVIAFAYLGAMLAFVSLSWPPEKLVMSSGGFTSLGFIMGCFMLNGAHEFAESSMCIAVSYLIAEILTALYCHYICFDKTDYLFMSTSYYKIAEESADAIPVARGVLKIIVINVVLSLFQLVSSQQLALPIFTVILNFWLISILAGKSQPIEFFSISKFSKDAVKGAFSSKRKKRKK